MIKNFTILDKNNETTDDVSYLLELYKKEFRQDKCIDAKIHPIPDLKDFVNYQEFEDNTHKSPLYGGVSIEVSMADHTVIIRYLVVKKEHRGKKIGEKLVSRIKAEYPKFTIRVKSLLSAVGFYKKMGFVPYGCKQINHVGLEIQTMMYNIKKY